MPHIFGVLEAAAWEDGLSLEDMCPWYAEALITQRAQSGRELRKKRTAKPDG
jgi:hypothetical protein